MSEAGAARWVALGAVDEFVEGVPGTAEACGWKLLVLRHDGGVSVLENRCTHAATRLDTGCVEDCVIACPLHRARFDLRDGAVLSGPATRPLPTFPARVLDGHLEALLTERPAPPRPPLPLRR